MANKFPHGKAGKDDEGEIQIAMAADKKYNCVRIIFPKPITWLGLDVTTAEAFVKTLESKIDELKHGS